MERIERGVVVLHEARNALVSATVSVSSGTASSLIAGDAELFLDIVEISFANNSTVGAAVALKSDGTTIKNFNIPAGGTVQLELGSLLRQQTKNTPWLVDMEDITGTTIIVDALLVRNNGK